MIELKPCPFCGFDAEKYTRTHPFDPDPTGFLPRIVRDELLTCRYHVICDNCGGANLAHGHTPEDAAGQWNMRADEKNLEKS